MKKVYSISEWIYRLAYINILWLLFSLLGIVAFGIFPATVALLSIIRKWLLKEEDFPIAKTFWNYYKDNFIKGNSIGILFVIIGSLIYIYVQYMNATLDSLLVLTHIPLYIFIIIALFVFLYILPVYVHYDVSLYQMYKNAFIIMMVNPLNNIFLLVSILVINRLLAYMPVSFLFFGVSMNAYIILWTCIRSFYKFEYKKEKLGV